jgi:hypothetical protein
MQKTLCCGFALLFGSLCMVAPESAAAQQPHLDKKAYYLWLHLPRFDGKKVNGAWSPTLDEIRKHLENENLPCVPKGLSSWGYLIRSKRTVIIRFFPTADSDLGDVAKSLAKLGGDKNKPVAAVQLSAVSPITVKQFETIKKELAKAKGIDWKNSDRTALALDEAGGARFAEIRAAYKKAGVELISNLDQ